MSVVASILIVIAFAPSGILMMHSAQLVACSSVFHETAMNPGSS